MNYARRIQILDEAEKDKGKTHLATYHAVRQVSSPTAKVNNDILPLFYESVATPSRGGSRGGDVVTLPSMMKYSIDIAISTTIFLNEGQITTVCGDQPLYAICKQHGYIHQNMAWIRFFL